MLGIFKIGFRELCVWDGPQTVILLISAFQVARIIGTWLYILLLSSFYHKIISILKYEEKCWEKAGLPQKGWRHSRGTQRTKHSTWLFALCHGPSEA
jgi:hypothetical protein